MKQTPRNPLRFDVFSAFAEYARTKRICFTQDGITEDFLSDVKSSVKESLQTDHFLHGLRVEEMFKALVLALGTASLIKDEDGGDVFSEEGVRIPDYRVILKNKKNLLVEVKNLFQTGHNATTKRFSMKKDYLDSLIRYSTLTGGDLKIAIYWSAWRVWTLVSPSVFSPEGDKLYLTMKDAMFKNEMSLLGDMFIGTRSPLTARLYTDPTYNQTLDENGTIICRISRFDLLCAGTLIKNSIEKRIALNFILYGDWIEETGASLVKDKKLQYVELNYIPLEQQEHQNGFEFVGSLSRMFSKYFSHFTIDGHQVKRLYADVSLEELGPFIPEGYKSKVLPLWRIMQNL